MPQSIIFLCGLLLTGPLAAQEYGHLNFANLLSEMPGTKAAEAELQAYNVQLTKKGEEMVAALQARVREVEAQRDDLTPRRMEELRAELTEQRDEIAQYERQMGVDIEKKRQELLGPLIQQARDAITAVAEEQGLLMVFDTSQFNSVLYARDSEDLMAAVKAKLGM
jgi:outer membrane protein